MKNSDQIVAGMVALLEDSGVLEKKASGDELVAIAGSLVRVADLADAAGAPDVADAVSMALGNLAEKGVEAEVAMPGADAELTAPDLVLKAEADTLIRIADRLDKMGHEEAASALDIALSHLGERLSG